jgi:hypothetical protein
MSKYQQFIFKDYSFDKAAKKLSLNYSFDDKISFTEEYHFNFDFIDFDPAALDRATQTLFFMAGVSYYKAYIPPQIKVESGLIDQEAANFLSKIYQRGLGEFFYVNKLDPKTAINFPVNSEPLTPLPGSRNGLLIGIGGGKDSLLTAEILRHYPGATTWSMGHISQLTPLVERIGLPHLWVDRQYDRAILAHNKQDAYNGHIPFSALLATVGTMVSVLSGRRDIVVSNESSASEPNLTYKGVEINHQYSKSLEFEQDFQAYLKHNFGESIRYYSFLRPLTELRIAELFSQIGFEKYKEVFSSCNRAFVHTSDHIFWCGECPKCAFVFLAFTPFIERKKLESLWHGKNLLLDPALEPTYRQLLGIEGDKPLDCVGEVKESRAAMRLAQKIYPELEKYEFELPAGYDFRKLGPHSMPQELADIVLA